MGPGWQMTLFNSYVAIWILTGLSILITYTMFCTKTFHFSVLPPWSKTIKKYCTSANWFIRKILFHFTLLDNFPCAWFTFSGFSIIGVMGTSHHLSINDQISLLKCQSNVSLIKVSSHQVFFPIHKSFSPLYCYLKWHISRKNRPLNL